MRTTRELGHARTVVMFTTGIALFGCGNAERPAPASNGPSITAPVVATPPPTLPPPPVATSCTLLPPNGMVVTTGRARPRPVVGATKLVVVSRRRGSGMGDDMENPWGIDALSFPLGASPGTTLVGPRSNGTYLNWANAERLGDAVVMERCGFESNLANIACDVQFLDVPAARPPVPLAVPRVDMAGSARFVLARDGDTYTAVLGYRGADANGVRAYRFGATGAPTAVRVGPGSSRLDPRDEGQLGLRVAARPDGTASIDVTFVQSGRTTHYELSAAGTVGEGVESVAPPATPALFSGMRAVEGEAQHVRITAAPTRPIEGIDEAIATFAPAFVEHVGGTTLVWSEGTGDSTRIRLARIDLTTGRLLGPITDVSTPAHEAGFAAIDAYADRAVVSWDEKNGRIWEVRAAEVRCAP